MLSPYRVLDLCDERGLACGQVLADLGADVIQIEPPSGSPARRIGPFYKGEAHPERSLHWWAFARNKRSVALDLDTREGQRALRRLVEGADFLVESETPGTMAARGLGYDDLAALNPRLVYVSITPFGQDGPKARYAATDLVVQAAAGSMILSGHPDRAPLRTAGVSAFSYAGAEAAGALLIAHQERLRSGRGQHVDVSAQLSANLAAGFTLLSSQIGQSPTRRSGGGVRTARLRLPFIWEAADGYVSLTLAFDPVNRPFSRRLLEWMCEEGACDAEARDRDWGAHLVQVGAGQVPTDRFERLKGAIAEFLRARTKHALLDAARERSLLLVPVATLDDVLASPQLEAREYWRDHARYPGPFVRFGRTPIRYRHRPPCVGEHTDEVLGETRPLPAPPADRDAPAESGLPLAGLKVLDFMWVMAGPYATRVLSDYGATVVKLESASRIDLVRVLPPFYGGQLGLETSAAFGSINAGKRSLALDLRKPEAREVVLDLVRWADVVTEAFSPRAMANWGFDYASLCEVRPDLIMLSTCLFGQTGPLSRMAGYGTMGAALAGLVQPTGWPDRPPSGPWGPYTDWIAPRFAVPALLAALDHRRRTGEGQYIDQSQAESSLHFLAPALLDCAVNGHALDRAANADPQMAPHGVYPARGEDAWVAIAVRDGRDWERLCVLLERPEWAADPRFASLEARLAHVEALDEELAAWTRAREPLEVERLLQEAGVPAHAVMHTGLAARDPQLARGGHFVEVPHALHGPVLVESTRIRLSRTPARVERAAPTIGQDTDPVLRELLGYAPDRIEALRAAGALT
jgi:crotonobetainyl-CoA:carnitine CoA-transferase CaiB-like acyl-CoA transferase